NNSSPNDDTATGHGTHIAGIIAAVRNDNGAVGVAYGSKILPVKVTDQNQGQDLGRTAAGIDHAVAAGARVINISLVNRADPQVEAALRRAADANRVIVLAAGNNASANPDFYGAYAPQLGGKAVSVVALNPDLTLAAFSNRAGFAAADTLAAPGVSIFSTTNDGGFRTDTGGTSWAAPHVAGAAALVLSAAPNLDAATALQILKDTAIDLGPAGVDPIFGHGLVSVQNALAPQGELNVPGGGGGGGGGGSGAGALVLVGGVGAAVAFALKKKKEPLEETLILDKYDRAYTIDMTEFLEVKDNSPDLSSLLQSFQSDSGYSQFDLGGDKTIAIQFVRPKQVQPDPLDPFYDFNESGLADQLWAMSLQGELATNLGYTVNFNTNARGNFGVAQHQSQLTGVSFLTEDVFSAPYLGFTSVGNSFNLGYQPSQDLNLKFGVVSSDDGEKHGLESDAAIIQGTYEVNDRALLNLQFGQLVEDGSLFGGDSDGPLSVKSSVTTSAGISGMFRLSDHFSLIASYTEGVTRVQEHDKAIIGEFSDISSESFGVGLLGSSVFRNNDEFGIAISRPMIATNGSAVLKVPYGRDLAGNIYRRTSRIDLAADASETDLEAFYKFKLGRETDIGAYLLYQDEPYHTDELDNRLTLYATFNRSF
ncbi:MAG: S8 family serine peptidase, partial [Gammaproteobacteria bacterium]|nr:S8 family serine peptidase [Gammaproteobacteria bacterium]